MAGKDIAKAYVQIVPSAKGIKNSLGSLLGGEAESAGKNAGGRFSTVFGTAAKAGLAALGVAAAGVASLTKAAVDSYAEYEQLAGGVKKLFGEESAAIIQKNAADAFKSAGMSANEYMQNATSISAALINSLGGDTAKAAELADVAMRSAADNANTFGVYTTEQIAGVYQSLAKGQWQTLDNLNLGYAGTKEGLEALVADANKYAAEQGKAANLTADNFADIVTAIDLVQDHMNISDTTINEAMTSIQGSFGMLKSSWQNLVTGFADPSADLGALISNFIESAGIAAQNVIPVISQALGGIGQVISELAPVITAELPNLITTLLPNLVSAAVNLVAGLVANLPSIIAALVQAVPGILLTIGETIVSTLDPLITAGAEAAASFLEGIASRISDIVAKGLEVVQSFVSGIRGAVGSVISAGLNLVQGIWQGISSGLGWIKGMITGWVGNVLDFIKRLFKINSPSQVMADEVGVFLAQGIGVGFADEMTDVTRMMQDAMPGMLDLRSDVKLSSALTPNRTGGSGFIEEIAAIRDDIRNMKIYLDTGKLIGAVDGGLGVNYAAAQRRALA